MTRMQTLVGVAASLISANVTAATVLFASPVGQGVDCSSLAPCSLQRAKDRVRELNGSMTGDITVKLLPGEYALEETLVFTAPDSGTGGHKIIYEGAGQGRTRLSGGVAISGWELSNGLYSAQIPSGLDFRQLYVNGRRAVRARTPNGDAYKRDLSWDKTEYNLKVRTPVGRVQNPEDLELVVTRHWQHHRLPVIPDGVTTDNRQILRILGGAAYRTFHEPAGTSSEGQPYHLEGAFEFVDAPDEWYLDKRLNRVFYKPDQATRLNRVIVPRLQTLLSVRGKVHDLVFRNMTFEHSTWLGPSHEGLVQIQAGWISTDGGDGYMPAAVEVRGPRAAYSIKFEDNEFRHLGANGLAFYSGIYDAQVVNNIFHDISGTAISVDADPARWDFTAAASRDAKIQNNLIYNAGVDYTGSVGIFAGFTDGALIEKNEIHSLPYTAISVGWGWTNLDNPARNNVVRRNLIYDVMRVHDDGGAIYTLSKQPGTLIEENHIYNVRRGARAEGYPIAAIYLDGASSLITVRNNGFRNVEKGVHLNDNTPPISRNNIVLENGPISAELALGSGRDTASK